MLEDKLEQDIKSALIAKDAERLSTLRVLKAVLLNIKVALGKRETGLSDEEVIGAFVKEVKKRDESASLYAQGNNQDRADKELREKAVIEEYLPQPVSEAEIETSIDEAIANQGRDPKNMGKIIGEVRAKLGPTADGALIARLVKDKLS